MSTSVLVTSFWLRKQLPLLKDVGNKAIRLLDATFLHERDTYNKFYKRQHIPGALFFDLNQCVHSSLMYPRNLPEPLCFESYIRQLGIHNDSHVVAYDQFDNRDAARVWWLLRAYGHKRVSVLDGGFKKWKHDGMEISNEEMPYEGKKSVYRVNLNRDIVRSFDDMMNILRSPDHNEQICDGRDIKHFKGEAKEPVKDMHHGHMPGAKSIPFMALVEDMGGYSVFKDAQSIMTVFLRSGVDLNRPVVATCQSGMMACSIALAAELIGMKDVPVYYGAWLEWSMRVKDELLVEQGHQTDWFQPCTDPNCRYCKNIRQYEAKEKAMKEAKAAEEAKFREEEDEVAKGA